MSKLEKGKKKERKNEHIQHITTLYQMKAGNTHTQTHTAKMNTQTRWETVQTKKKQGAGLVL